MKPIFRAALILGIGLFAAGIIVYSISCSNAGHALAWDEFAEGLLGHGSNCGGNSAAQSVCSSVAIAAKMLADDRSDTFKFDGLNDEQMNSLRDAASGRHWTPNAKYLVRKEWVSSTNSHEIVVICDVAYGNIPQPSFWNLHRRTLRHAAGYSDGKSALLTPAQFKDLNLAGFVELPDLQSTVGTNHFE